MKTVLAPIDFSAVSKSVVKEAVALAQALNDRVVLAHIISPETALDAETSGTRPKVGYLMEAEKDAMAKLANWQQRLLRQGVTAETVHAIGQAGPQILREADRLNAAYIVMGSHGHGAFFDLFVGSTTNRVLKETKCAVVIVPAKRAWKTTRSRRIVRHRVACLGRAG